MNKNIQIISNLCDLEHIDKKNIIICFNISAQNILKKKKIKYLSPLDFLVTSDHKKIINLSLKIRNSFFKTLGEMNDLKYSKSLNNLFSFKLRYYINFLAIQLILIKKITKKYKPQIIFISTELNKKSIITNDSIFSFLFKSYLHQSKSKTKIVTKIRRKKNIKINKFIYITSIKNFILNFSISAFNYIFCNNKKTILVLSPDYGLDLFVKNIIRRYQNFSVIFLEYSNILNLKDIFFYRIFYFFNKKIKLNNKEKNKIYYFYKKKITQNKNIFTFQNYNFCDNILDYFELFLIDEIFIFSEKINSANNYFVKNKPKLIISHNSFLMGHFLGEFAKYNKIPSIVISHGTHTFDTDKIIFYEWCESAKYLMNPIFDYISAQSPLINEFLLKNGSTKKIIKTGPVIFSHRLKTKSKKKLDIYRGKKIILHASTPKSFNTFRPIIFENIEEYIKQINSLISVIDRINNFHLIIKFRPSKELCYETFKDSLIKSKNYTISTEENLNFLLNISDCLISYSSTVIEEMLNYKKPVILFDSFKRYCHVSKKYIKNNLEFKLAPINYLTNNFQLEKSLKSLKNINIDKFQKNKFWSQYIYPIDKKLNWIKHIKF